MKAITYTKYGPPEVLQLKEMDKPVPKADEVLVRVMASTVNRTDCAMLRGTPFVYRFFIGLFAPKKAIPGTDFAGYIEAVGHEVKAFKVGDKIWGFNDEGLSSHAQYLSISEEQAILKIPSNISYEQAAASAEGIHYAYNFLRKIPLEAGQKILVNGATGGIGSATVQILKSMDIEVTAVCAGENTALIKALGADHLIDYTKEDFTKSDQQFDYVLDTVGKSSFYKCKPIIKAGGSYISSELGWMSQNIFFAISTPLIAKIVGKKRKKTVRFPLPTDTKRSLLFIRDLLERGAYDPLLDRKYPLADIAAAYRYVEKGQKIGNVIITME